MQPASTGNYQGNISTQNIGAPNGNAVTANSTVSCTLNGGYDTASIQITGTYTGILTVQVQLDNGTWVDFTGATSLTNAASGAQSATIASATQGIFQLDVSGFNGVRVTAKAAVTGTAVVTIEAGAGSGIVGIDTPLQFATGQTVNSTSTPVAGTDFALTAAATTNATVVKATAGQLFEITADNETAAIKYLKLYRKATAPTVGTDVPILTIPIPANGDVSRNFGELGKRFTTGIVYALTGLQAVADTTALAAGDVHVHGTFS